MTAIVWVDSLKPLSLWANAAHSRRQQNVDIFSYFSQKQNLTFYANCLHLHEMSNLVNWKKKKKNISKCDLLKFYPES